MGTTKSPSTGYSVTDYVKKAFEHLQISNAEFARRVGVYDSNTIGWQNGKTEPTVGSLRRMEEISGIPIGDYLPEMEHGWTLLNKAREWRSGFVFTRMKTKGVHISAQRCKDALNGIVKDKKLTVGQLIELHDYYEWWCSEEERQKAERERKEKQRIANLARKAQGRAEHCRRLLVRRQSLEDASEEEYAILDIYYRVMGTSGADDFNLRRITPRIWACETEHYRVEFDLDKEELRVFWKETSDLSFRRDFCEIA